MSTISIQPDLLKLKGSSLRRDNAENGGRGFIKIYIDEAGLGVFGRKEGKGCTLPIIVREKSDNYGNDFLVTRGYSKAETEWNKTAPEGAKKQTEILGNGKWLVKPDSGTGATDTTGFQEEPAKAAGAGDNPDDLPF